MKVQYKRLIIISIVFFLLIQTSYFWEPWLETWNMLSIFILVIVFMTLAGLFLSHLVMLIKERFRNQQRLIVAAALFVAVSTSCLKLTGLIDFDRLAGKDLFVAKREGAANCQTILKLKDNNAFVERRVCFGISEIKGTYAVKGDTILFTNAKPARGNEKYYMYAVIKKGKVKNTQLTTFGDLELYKDEKDTTGHLLIITKNDFPL